ncbi:MAG: hypothetical protein JWO28_989 [Hyphomicrobiales bacterium]|jgi:hypothetical protein|nr:hypothetical protein [Hyphomicrobiales bacterium]
MRIPVLCAAILLLAGCARQAPPQPISPSQSASDASFDDTACMMMGVKRDTPAFMDCRQKIQAKREEKNAGKPQGSGPSARTTETITRSSRGITVN